MRRLLVLRRWFSASFLASVSALFFMSFGWGSRALAGPNAGGTIILHDPNYISCLDRDRYCGLGTPPASCAEADVRLDGTLVECYWFAGYNYYAPEPQIVQLRNNPDPVLGGYFIGDSIVDDGDPIAGYGSLGFDTDGRAVCPEVPPVPVGSSTWGRIKQRYW
jgi:hypothetical protein